MRVRLLSIVAILAQITVGSMCMMQVAHATGGEDMQEMHMSHVDNTQATHHEAPVEADCSKGDCFIQSNSVEVAAAQASVEILVPVLLDISVLTAIDTGNVAYALHATAPPLTHSFTQTLVLRC